MTIDSFYDRATGVHLPLSNFAPSPFVARHWRFDETAEFATVEHYYQSAKTAVKTEAETIRLSSTPGKAKRAGRQIKIVRVWEEEKLDIMLYALRLKFDYGTPLAGYLLSTGDQLLAEGNTWGDRFWGVCDGTGKNWLGLLLMARRAELRAHASLMSDA